MESILFFLLLNMPFILFSIRCFAWILFKNKDNYTINSALTNNIFIIMLCTIVGALPFVVDVLFIMDMIFYHTYSVSMPLFGFYFSVAGVVYYCLNLIMYYDLNMRRRTMPRSQVRRLQFVLVVCGLATWVGIWTLIRSINIFNNEWIIYSYYIIAFIVINVLTTLAIRAIQCPHVPLKDSNIAKRQEIYSNTEEEANETEFIHFSTPIIFPLTTLWRQRVLYFLLGIFVPLFCLLMAGAILLLFIIAPHSSSGLAAPVAFGLGTMLVALAILYFFFPVLLSILSIRHVVTPQGIAYYFPGYALYAPWSKIRGIGQRRLGFSSIPVLLLEHPALEGKVQDGYRTGRITIQRSWYAKLLPVRGDTLPIAFTVPESWQESELGSYIQQYATQIFQRM